MNENAFGSIVGILLTDAWRLGAREPADALRIASMQFLPALMEQNAFRELHDVVRLLSDCEPIYPEIALKCMRFGQLAFASRRLDPYGA